MDNRHSGNLLSVGLHCPLSHSLAVLMTQIRKLGLRNLKLP